MTKEMRIREFNRRAEDVFHTSRQDALRMYLFELIDTKDFEEVYHTHENKLRVKQKWEQYNMTVLETIVYIPSSDRVLAIIEDVSAEEKQAERMLEQKLNTVKLAQAVVEKQMTTAQEIAGLLGETTAETKAILTKLRDTLLES